MTPSAVIVGLLLGYWSVRIVFALQIPERQGIDQTILGSTPSSLSEGSTPSPLSEEEIGVLGRGLDRFLRILSTMPTPAVSVPILQQYYGLVTNLGPTVVQAKKLALHDRSYKLMPTRQVTMDMGLKEEGPDTFLLRGDSLRGGRYTVIYHFKHDMDPLVFSALTELSSFARDPRVVEALRKQARSDH